MKIPIGILTTDWHIDNNNHQEVNLVLNQIISLAEKLKIPIYNLGDTFESRKAQPLQNLKFFNDILSILKNKNLELITIPGNHDKVNLSSEDSYLDSFLYHPSLKLKQDVSFISKNDILICLIPFFNQKGDIYNLKLKNAIEQLKHNKNKTSKRVLLTHIAIDGVKNNDGSKEDSSLKQDLFEVFDQVFVGHYHNKQDLNEKIHYIGSIRSLNYGEDNDKGCVILYDDLSFEYVKTSFKKFEKISINIDNTSPKEIKTLIEQYKNSADNIRIEFKGDASKLKSIDVEELVCCGIDVKIKQKELIEGINLAEHNEVISFDKEGLLTEFDDFCVINNIEKENKEYGLEKLNIILNEKK